MFQVGMSRPLVIAALLLVILAGCVAQPKTPTETAADVQTCACTQLQNLLDLQHKVSTMRTEEIKKQLAGLGQPKAPQQLFYFGLLNQQLDAFTPWTQARNTFQQLAADTGLTKEQRDLAAILERYTQSRINWYLQHHQLLEKYGTLEAELGASQEENKLLERKIKAITDLETSISTRKEQ
jgi:hypothetical protein